MNVKEILIIEGKVHGVLDNDTEDKHNWSVVVIPIDKSNLPPGVENATLRMTYDKKPSFRKGMLVDIVIASPQQTTLEAMASKPKHKGSGKEKFGVDVATREGGKAVIASVKTALNDGTVEVLATSPTTSPVKDLAEACDLGPVKDMVKSLEDVGRESSEKIANAYKTAMILSARGLLLGLATVPDINAMEARLTKQDAFALGEEILVQAKNGVFVTPTVRGYLHEGNSVFDAGRRIREHFVVVQMGGTKVDPKVVQNRQTSMAKARLKDWNTHNPLKGQKEEPPLISEKDIKRAIENGDVRPLPGMNDPKPEPNRPKEVPAPEGEHRWEHEFDETTDPIRPHHYTCAGCKGSRRYSTKRRPNKKGCPGVK